MAKIIIGTVMLKSVSVLMLLTVLFLSTRLLFAFSYDSFFPWSFDFGLYLYCSIMVFCLLVGEIFFKERYKFLFPILLIALSSLIFFIVLNYFEPKTSHGHGAGGLIYLILIVVVNFGFFLYGLLRIPLGITSIIIEKWELYSKLIEKYFTQISLILLLSILSVNAFSFYDYSTKGRDFKLSYKSNFNTLVETTIRNDDISYCQDTAKENNSSRLSECYRAFFKSRLEIKQFYAVKHIFKHSSFFSYKPGYIPEQYFLFESKNKMTSLLCKDFPNTEECKDVRILKKAKEPLNYFKIYNDLMTQNCKKITNQRACKDALIESTYSILGYNVDQYFNNAIIAYVEIPVFPIFPIFPRSLVITIKTKDQNKIKKALNGIASISLNSNNYKRSTSKPKDFFEFTINIHKLVDNQTDLENILMILLDK